MAFVQVAHKCRLIVELWRDARRLVVIEVTVPPLCMNPIRPFKRVPPLHMIHPVLQTVEVLKGLTALLGYTDVRLDVVVNVSPRDIPVRGFHVESGE